MQSVNFEFLRTARAELADLAALAEQYAHPDPTGALSKLRAFAEQIVRIAWHELRLPAWSGASFFDRLTDDTFEGVTPRPVLDKLHTLRKLGNRAVHSDTGTTRDALDALRDAWDVGRYVHVRFDRGQTAAAGTFTPPGPPLDPRALVEQKSALQRKLAAQEAQLAEVIRELEEARRAEQQHHAQLSEAARTAAHQAGEQVARALELDEATTRRRLIDTDLRLAGWDPDDPDDVGTEIAVDGQPTPSGRGRIDYVLWDDDGRPLAIIEAKRTAVDAQQGREQARLYADALQAVDREGRRPVIFCTNGHESWIWVEADGGARRIFGFYNKKSLQALHAQIAVRTPLTHAPIKPAITGRLYQQTAIKSVCERFDAKHRKALIVMATGTGKTRVAVSLCDVLVNAGWATRILFLCDRRELRKQAHATFQEFMPGEPRVIVNASTYGDRQKRLYFATYPAMMKCYTQFDVGFFDLIIADESHRSIYKVYGELFQYFDARRIGLTATPVQFVARNTYRLFGCPDGIPTYYYAYRDAVEQGYLVPFEVQAVRTWYLERGIRYSEMSEAQRRELEDEPAPETIEHEARAVDRDIFNKETNRIVLRHLMEHGIRDADGGAVGKSIVFARNHNHAMLLRELFDEMYPQYGGRMCVVIDNYEPRAEALIDEFKEPDSRLKIAISVDMLDTGIDVPEVVNLVFAKPVGTETKFWQMIGRGTRLCPGLFGPGQDKTRFLIFDHWANFEHFDDLDAPPPEPSVARSPLERLFLARVDLARTALDAHDIDVFGTAIELLRQDVAALMAPGIARSIPVLERWSAVQEMLSEEILYAWSHVTEATLRDVIAPLMAQRPLLDAEATRFDLLMARLQISLLLETSDLTEYRGELHESIDRLPGNLDEVRAKFDTLHKVQGTEFWSSVTFDEIESVRLALRGIMKHQRRAPRVRAVPRVIDTQDRITVMAQVRVRLEGLELAEYRHKTEGVLRALLDENETLQRIQRGKSVEAADLEALRSLVLMQRPDIDLTVLLDFYPETTARLDEAIRGIIGRDAATVRARFEAFCAQQFGRLNAQQLRFMGLLQNHITRYGGIQIERLYEDPFTTLHAEGVDGLFDESQVDTVIEFIASFDSEASDSPENGGAPAS